MKKGAKEWESNLKSSLRVLSVLRIFHFEGLFLLCGHWSQADVDHFNIQKAAFQNGVKCGRSAVDTVAVGVCLGTAPIP